MSALFQEGQVAVITGAASGIGAAVSADLAARGVAVCMVDLPGSGLEALADELTGAVSYPSDLSQPGAMNGIRDSVLDRFGAIDFLFNNAVTRAGRGMDASLEAWREAMEVNLWAVIEGTRAFLPSMLESRRRGWIVNAGSKQGITNPPGHPIYNITKSALKTYTEALEHDLRNQEGNQGDTRLSTHLLIPGWTKPAGDDHPDGAWFPEQVSSFMWECLERGEFYILCPDNEVTVDMDHRRILWGAEDIIRNRPPLSRWHEDFAGQAKEVCS